MIRFAGRRRGRQMPYMAVAATVLVFFLLLVIGWSIFRPRPAPKAVLPEAAYGLPVYTAFLPEDTQGRPGEKRRIRYIVIHETGNFNEGSDAKSHSAYLRSGKSGTTSWHYTVDDHEAYHHIPDDEIAWHAGDKKREKGGNACGVGIELCVNADGDFEKTFDNGARLTAYLLNAYGLSIRNVKQHADFMEKNCPQTIRDNGRWEEFLEKVSLYQKSEEKS